MRTDANGNIVWRRCIGGSGNDEVSSLEITHDGGYIIAGYSNSNDGDATNSGYSGSLFDFWIVKLDANGNILWQQAYGGNDIDQAYSIIETSPNEFYVVGGTYSTGGNVPPLVGTSPNIWVLHINVVANVPNIIWSTTYAPNGQSCFGFSLIQNSAGNIIIAGSTVNTITGLDEALVLVIDPSTGIQTNFFTFPSTQGFGSWANVIIQNNTGGYAFCGTLFDYVNNLRYDWVVTLNNQFIQINQTSFNQTPYADEVYNDIIQTRDGNYVVAARTRNSNYLYGWLIHSINATTLNTIWQLNYGAALSCEAVSIRQTTDCGFIVGGTCNNVSSIFSTNNGEGDYWLVKLNSNNAPIIGSQTACIGVPQQYSNSVTGGTWSVSNSNATINSQGLLTPINVGAVTITYTINGCSFTIDVTISNCNPCLSSYSNITTITGTNGILSGNHTFTNGNYFIPYDITIDGVVTFTNAEVLMGNNVQFTVANVAQLHLNGSHFYSCHNMWRGFVAAGEYSVIKLNYSNSIDRTKSCLIEDAETAIFWNFNNTYPDHSENVLVSRGTIFNRNRDGIVLQNFNAPEIFYTTGYPFKLHENVFTCRDIPFTAGARNWADYEALLLPDPLVYNSPNYVSWSLPPIYQSPYINTNHFSTTNTRSYLKITNGTLQKSQRGIVLNRVAHSQIGLGATLGLNFRHSESQNDYNPTPEFNPPFPTVFDNLNIGIEVEQSNLRMLNGVFQNPNALANNKFGVFAINSNPNNFLHLDGSGSSIRNSFFDLNTAVYCQNYQNINVNNCAFRSNKALSTTTQKGHNGFFSLSTNYNNVSITNNEITNIGTGIYVYSAFTASVSQPGVVNIANNLIQSSTPYLIGTTGNEYVNIGIVVEAQIRNRITVNEVAPITINANTFTNVFNGISVRNIRAKSFIINNNTIQLHQHNTLNSNFSYGIAAIGGYPDVQNQIQNNIITGNSNLSFNQSGIFVERQNGTNIGCNNVSLLQNGFRFNNLNHNTKFWDNLMQPTNLYGFNLENNGYIGAQGITGPRGSRCTSDNSWGGTNATWQSLGHYKNAISNSFAYNSPFYINNAASQWRNFDGSSFVQTGGLTIFPYQLINNSGTSTSNQSIFLMPNDNGSNCERCNWTSPVQLDFGEEEEPILESIANGSLEIISDEPQQELYVLQQELYSKLKENDTLTNNNSVLQNFVQANTWGSFDFIYYTEKMLEAKDFSTANLLLQYFPSNNIVDDNYWQYFTWVTNMQTIPNYQPNLDHVYAMANKCPYKNSNVVYAARNLYNALTKKYTEFNPNCEPIAARMANKPKTNAGQRTTKTLEEEVKLFPNPTTNVITVFGKDVVSISVLNMQGKVLLVQQNLNNLQTKIDLSKFSAGIYFIKTIDKTGKPKVQKIVKQ